MDFPNPNRVAIGTPALRKALEAVERLGRDGYSLAPADPSPAMIRAGSRAGRVTLEEAEAIYRAMINAVE